MGSLDYNFRWAGEVKTELLAEKLKARTKYRPLRVQEEDL
jgi:hypothetical protein